MSTNRPFINEYRQWREETFRRSNSPIVSYEDWLNSNYPDHYNELMGNASRGEVLRRRNEDRRGRTVPPDNILRAAYDLYLREFPAHAGEEPRTYVEWINIAEIHDNRFIRNAIDASNADQLRGRTFDTVIIDEHIEWNNERHPASRRYTLPHTGTYVISTPNGDETWIRPERDGTPNIQFPSVLNSTREENHTLFNEYMEYVRNTGNGASFLNFESWHRRTYNLPNPQFRGRSPIEDIIAEMPPHLRQSLSEMQRAMRDQILYGQGAVRVETDENNNPSIERIDMHAENLFDEMNAPSTARPMSPSPNPKLTDNVYQYLDQLQASAGRRLLTDELKLFEGLTNKLDINRIFFGLPKPGDPEPLSEEKIKKLSEHYTALAQTRNSELVRSVTRDIDANLKIANDGYTRIKEALQKVATSRSDLEAITLKVPDYTEVINKALQNPFWTLHNVSSQTVDFASNEIIVSDKRPKLGIDMTVNFGRILLKWNTSANYIMAARFEKNFQGNYYHPHISSTHDFCLGNASSAITKALKEVKIDEVLSVMQALLTTYNPDSPYMPLAEFFAQQNPEELKKGECSYQARGEVRFRDEYIGDIRPRVIEEDYDDNGELLLRCRYYQLCNTRYNLPVSETHYFMSGNNRYIEFDHNDEDLVYDWD